jgi:protein phosphatase
MLRAFGATDKGPVRQTNEDCFAIDEERRLLIVADGMGGHRAGEVAAQLTVETIHRAVKHEAKTIRSSGFDHSLSAAGNLLRTAVLAANRRVLEAAGSDEKYQGMGTTVVAAMVRGDRLTVAHVGDSRFYLFAGGHLRQITTDDSWIASVLAQDPNADLAALRHHPMRYALINVVGRQSPPDVHIAEEVLDGAAWFALTTDGVHGTLGELPMGEIFQKKHQPEQIAAGLVREALALGSRDNCTAVVAGYEPDEAE